MGVHFFRVLLHFYVTIFQTFAPSSRPPHPVCIYNFLFQSSSKNRILSGLRERVGQRGKVCHQPLQGSLQHRHHRSGPADAQRPTTRIGQFKTYNSGTLLFRGSKLSQSSLPIQLFSSITCLLKMLKTRNTS